MCRLFEAYENRATNVELQRRFPALRLCQIESKASHVGAVRRKAPLVTFDIPALDAIRARSVEMGLLLAELDERAGTRRFFQKSCRRPALKHIVRAATFLGGDVMIRSEEHTSELQSLMRISYAVFCLKKKTRNKRHKRTEIPIEAHNNPVTRIEHNGK